MNRELLEPIGGTLKTPIGPTRFQFVATGTALPAVVLTNHGLAPEFKFDGREVRFRFLIALAGQGNRWQRTDAAEPYCDFVDGTDTVPAMVRDTVHDQLLDLWEKYTDAKPELLTYARLVDVSNQIFQQDDTIARLEAQLKKAKGVRENLLDLERGIKATLPSKTPPIPDAERDILSLMVSENCWLTTDATGAELHPYNSSAVLKTVDPEASQRLILGGFVQLHRHLADGRTAWKIADRGRQSVEK